jgi:cadmium resistance protein CadD (predicted permease)
VNNISAVILTAVSLFVGTNIDDMVVLSVLNVSSKTQGSPRKWQIWTGQYVGVAGLTGLSLAAAAGLTILPTRWVWLLGFIPLTLGVVKLFAAIRDRRDGAPPRLLSATGLIGVIGLTISNGGDNLAAYTPIFRTMTTETLLVTLAVFAVLVAIWCWVAGLLVSHHKVTETVIRFGHWIIPVVYILIGLYVFYESSV